MEIAGVSSKLRVFVSSIIDARRKNFIPKPNDAHHG